MAFFCIHCRSEIDPKYKACPFCGEAITDFLRRYLENPIDGKYQILARLGVGGMGEVFKVLHLHLNAIRVIKLMRSSIVNEAGAHDRFLREARLATRIQHPNVATLFDFSTLEDGSLYMVWEYIEGINLHELLESRGPLSPKYAASLAVQTLNGLEAIHRAGIVHRDISPENLMILHSEEGDERVKIIDLGIAKQWADDADRNTKTGMFVGKWKYCSPEHLGMLPEGQRIDSRADLYSFGIVLYEMLTGVPPFQADTPHSYLVMHASERPRALREVNPTVTASPELEAIIFRALEKDRNNRFANAREFARAIDQIAPSLQDKPGSSTPVTLAIEVTEEPTRVIDSPAATMVTLSAPETVETLNAEQPSSRLLTTVADVDERTSSTFRPWSIRWISTAAVAAVAVVSFGIWQSQRPSAPSMPALSVSRSTAPPQQQIKVPDPQPVTAAATVVPAKTLPPPATAMAVAAAKTLPPPATAMAAAPVPIPAASGHLGINAFPWGEVTRIRNLTTGKIIALRSPLVTPVPLDLPAGRYEITLENPAFDAPIIKNVLVKPGEEQTITAEFTDANSAPLPRFEGTLP